VDRDAVREQIPDDLVQQQAAVSLMTTAKQPTVRPHTSVNFGGVELVARRSESESE
jgi:hypothetical protein